MEANVQLCRVCVTNSTSSTMMSIFGQDSLWQKIKTFADVEIEEGDDLPQQVCVSCAKNAINACLFKKKCEQADSYYRRQLAKKLDVTQDVITISESSDDENDFDFSSICLSDQGSFNGLQNGNFENSVDDDHLALIPEIELITPNDNLNSKPEEETHNFQCSLCYSMFQKKEILKHHMVTCHTKRTPMYECFNCKKTYLYKRFLEKHVRRGRCKKRRRNQTRPMQCSDCHILFQSGHHLGWHKRTGCPSRRSTEGTATENIVQYNNFPTKNSLYIYNRRKFITNTKRKGRTRIKLDGKKIALAKQLILKEATTSKIAEALDISRTFAWRLRKNLVNGINLQERVVERYDDSNDSRLKIGEIIDEKKSEGDSSCSAVQENIPQDLSKANYLHTPMPLVVKIEENARSEEYSPEPKGELPKDNFEGNNYYIDGNDEGNDNDDNNMSPIYRDNSPQPGCSNHVSENMETNSENSFSLENSQQKKPRKPNVFLDEEKYAKAKILLAQNTSTMELAQQLNVSQMTAWKLRDAIMKGIPLKFRCKSSPKTQEERRKLSQHLMKPRRRLKASERIERDKEITRELLALIKEDNNLQYWKISEKMSDKGFQLSPSSVCQKLKALGLHRRWKGGDRSQALDDSVKFDESIDDGGSFNYNNENQLNMSGAHFLSAFTD